MRGGLQQHERGGELVHVPHLFWYVYAGVLAVAVVDQQQYAYKEHHDWASCCKTPSVHLLTLCSMCLLRGAACRGPCHAALLLLPPHRAPGGQHRVCAWWRAALPPGVWLGAHQPGDPGVDAGACQSAPAAVPDR
jgi:hypothetical protein